MKRLTHRAICGAAGVLTVLSVGPVFGQEAFSGHSGTNPAVARNKAADPPQLVSTGRIGLLAAASADRSDRAAESTEGSAGSEEGSEQRSTGFLGRELGLPEDAVARRQSVDAYTSLEDGQPGGPGELELQLDLAWQTTSGERDPGLVEVELEYTPNWCSFVRNSQFILSVPLELGVGGVEGNGDIEFGWQQRWVKEEGMMPTLATLAEVRLPSGYESSGVDGTFTGIVAKDLGPGTLYFNAFAKTANGDNVEDLRHFQWGLRTGYKWRISDKLALIGDYVHQVSEEEGNGDLNGLEISGEYRLTENLTVGPGIFIGLDDNDETPNFGAGVRLTLGF